MVDESVESLLYHPGLGTHWGSNTIAVLTQTPAFPKERERRPNHTYQGREGITHPKLILQE